MASGGRLVVAGNLYRCVATPHPPTPPRPPTCCLIPPHTLRKGATYLLQREPSEPTDFDDEPTNTNPSGLDSPKRGNASKTPLGTNPTPPVVRLYDLSAMSQTPTKKWKWLLAMLSYRFAMRLRLHLLTLADTAATAAAAGAQNGVSSSGGGGGGGGGGKSGGGGSSSGGGGQSGPSVVKSRSPNKPQRGGGDEGSGGGAKNGGSTKGGGDEGGGGGGGSGEGGPKGGLPVPSQAEQEINSLVRVELYERNFKAKIIKLIKHNFILSHLKSHFSLSRSSFLVIQPYS